MSTASNDSPFSPPLLLAALFAGTLAISSVLAVKIVQIGGLFAPAGVLAFSFTFACTDIASEVYGRKVATRLVLVGMVVLVVVGLLSLLAVLWPAAPIWQDQEAFVAIIGRSPRIIIASLGAYLVSQNLDIFIFERLKRVESTRFLWLRNNVSTAISQLVDTNLFIVLAFYGSGFPLWPLIFGQWMLKLVIAVLDTPFVYLGVWFYRRKSRVG